MKIRAFTTHKLAEHYSDCQDRFSIDQDTKSVALADGMSQSYQQKIWASLLVDTYTQNVEFVPNHAAIKELSSQWTSRVENFIDKLRQDSAPQYLIIMNENALAMHKSAGATFLGIRFNGNKWEGDVLGDSCLIEIEDNQIKRILTSQQGNEFDSHPDYFDSDALKEGKGTPLQINGEVTNQTSIILVSDPFSDFLNEKKKEGKEEVYIKELLSIETHDQYEESVARWRNTYGMHNDDSTLIIIEHDGSEDFNCANIDDIQSLISEEQKKQEVLEQQKESSETTQTIETTSSETQEEPTKDIEPIIDKPIEMPILENEFEKMFFDELHNQRKNSKKYKFLRKEPDDVLKKTLKAVYKKLNITKK